MRDIPQQSVRMVDPSLGLIGYLDRISTTRIDGWAWDPLDPDATLKIRLAIGETTLSVCDASFPRTDVKAGGLGSGAYGFILNFHFPLEARATTIQLRLIGETSRRVFDIQIPYSFNAIYCEEMATRLAKLF